MIGPSTKVLFVLLGLLCDGVLPSNVGLQEEPCILYVKEFMCVPGEEEQCPEIGLDCYRKNYATENDEWYEVDVSRSWIEKMIEDGTIVSGASYLTSGTIDGVTIRMDENPYPNIATPQVDINSLSSPRTGDVNMLVIRITTADFVPRWSAKQYGDDVFGNGDIGPDPVNVKSQLYDCSYGQLRLRPGDPTDKAHPHDDGHKGVIEVDVSPLTLENDMGAIKDAAITAANAKLGFDLPNVYGNVYFMVDRCFGCGWAAWAYINHWTSFYQSSYALYSAVQQHEHGHNLGLYHSGGLDRQAYTDHTCLMGNPLYSDDVGKMCFNSPKNYLLGWYGKEDPDFITLFQGSFSRWFGKIIGIAEWKDGDYELPVGVMIAYGGTTDIYVAFNRAMGINSQNDQADDMVTVVEAPYSTSISPQSYLQATLSKNQSHKITGLGGSIIVKVCDIKLDSTPGYANVLIYHEGGGDSCTAFMPSSNPSKSNNPSNSRFPSISPSKSHFPSKSQAPSVGEDYTYLGCFKDASDRALPKMIGSGSVEQCHKNCDAYHYFGRQYFGECWCGNGKYDKHGPTTGCNCEGANVGSWKNCVYDNNSYRETNKPSLSPTSKQTNVPSSNPSKHPSNNPTETNAPSSNPSEHPSNNPTETNVPSNDLTSRPSRICKDTRTKFKVNKKKFKGCYFLSKKQHRIDSFCGQTKRLAGDGGKALVCTLCCKTCLKCTNCPSTCQVD